MKFILTFLAAVFILLACAKKTIPVAAVPAETRTSGASSADSIKIHVMKGDESTAVITGREIYNAKCGGCHGLKNPGDYTADRWVGILNIMAVKAALNDAEKENVLAFVQYHSKGI